MRVQVLDALPEVDAPGVILFGGVIAGTEDKVTFHMRGAQADQLYAHVLAGRHVEVTVPMEVPNA